jgi:flagellar biosynthesis/type III secretory pathway chaperone
MSDLTNDSMMQDKLALIVRHLQVESGHLDTVIESSLEMQSILRARRTPIAPSQNESGSVDNPPTTGLRVDRNQRLNQRMLKLRADIEQNFQPIAQGRKQLVDVVKTMDPNAEKTPTLSELAMHVEEPLRSKLKLLRNEIRGKLNRVHSISMGNQAVLLYTLDFYNRLLSGLSSDDQQSSYYNADGRSQNHSAGNIVQTNC